MNRIDAVGSIRKSCTWMFVFMALQVEVVNMDGQDEQDCCC